MAPTLSFSATRAAASSPDPLRRRTAPAATGGEPTTLASSATAWLSRSAGRMLALAMSILACMTGGCGQGPTEDRQPGKEPPLSEAPQRGAVSEPGPGSSEPAEPPQMALERHEMVERQLRGRDITDPRVLEAMATVPRHLFVPPSQAAWAYQDGPLPIGHGQTISQPYIVALMTQLARPRPTARVLDIGTGSGYQAAVLAELVDQVYSIEIVEPLGLAARQRLKELGYDNVEVRVGDGYRGWPEKAPFDAIIVAAAPPEIPQPLIAQLAPGGRLVIPVGRYWQELMVVEKDAVGRTRQWSVTPVAFVPMTGEAERRAAPNGGDNGGP